MTTEAKIKFEPGKSYFGEFAVYCHYKGWLNQIGTNTIRVECTSRTGASITFKVYHTDGTQSIRRGRIQYLEGHGGIQEFVHLPAKKNFKELAIQSEQEYYEGKPADY